MKYLPKNTCLWHFGWKDYSYSPHSLDLAYHKDLSPEICEKHWVKLRPNSDKMWAVGHLLPKEPRDMLENVCGNRDKDAWGNKLTLRTLFVYRCVQCGAFGEVYLNNEDRFDTPIIRVFLSLNMPHQTCKNFIRFEPRSKYVWFTYASLDSNIKTKVCLYFESLLTTPQEGEPVHDYCKHTSKYISKVYNM